MEFMSQSTHPHIALVAEEGGLGDVVGTGTPGNPRCLQPVAKRGIQRFFHLGGSQNPQWSCEWQGHGYGFLSSNAYISGELRIAGHGYGFLCGNAHITGWFSLIQHSNTLTVCCAPAVPYSVSYRHSLPQEMTL